MIAPSKIFKFKDDDETKIEFDKEGFEFLGPTDIILAENWIHQMPMILKAGRVKHWFPPNVEDEAKEKAEADDPVMERLKSIVEDTPFEGFESNWVIRTYGDQQTFGGEDEGKTNVYSSTQFRSLTWQGAMTLAMVSRQSWAFMYLGSGMKVVQPFIPNQPDNIKDDPEDLEEFDEPNPKKAPSESIEPDSDEGAQDEEEG